MPPTRQPPNNDPFTSALHPTSSNSAHPARRYAIVTSRPGQPPEFFVPGITRPPTSRFVARGNERGVLADTDSDAENEGSAQRPQRRTRGRGVGVRQGSPEKVGKGLGKQQEEEVEIVNRRADGGYLLGVPGVGGTVPVPVVEVPRTEEEVEQEEVDAHYNAISRQFFASGASLGGRSSKKHEEELEQLRLPMMLRLKEQVTEKLEGERWQYESVDRFQPTM